MGVFIRFSTVPVSIRLPGLLRPSSERAALVCMAAGFVDTLYVKEGELVDKDQVILSIKNLERQEKLSQLEYESRHCISDIRDLEILCSLSPQETDMKSIVSPVLREQLSRVKLRMRELDVLAIKAENDFKVTRELFKNKVIPSKDFSDKELEFEHYRLASETSKKEQMIYWHQELMDLRQKLKTVESQIKLYKANEEWFLVRAPVKGVVQGIRSIYRGSAVQSGQALGSVSPDAILIVECYAGADKIGFVKIEQNCRFQVDAFDSKYFGWLEGKVLSIDDDFTMMDGRPSYKLRCSILQPQLLLKNGYIGILKKGMTVQARFTLAERKLWQLLWDNLDDWLNPQSGSQSQARVR